MSQTKAAKSFDCLAFKDRAQETILRETRGMSRDEEIEYLNRRAERGAVGEWWRRLRRPPAQTTPESAST
jgi:hypothetical protein